VQLFDSVKIYVFVFCLGAIIAVEKLRQLIHGPRLVSASGSGIENNVYVIITIFMLFYLPGLMLKLSNRIERIAIGLFEMACLLSLADWLAGIGIAWAAIPFNLFLGATIDCAIAVLAGVRTFQVVWLRRRGGWPTSGD
jgi:hypothetical protein